MTFKEFYEKAVRCFSDREEVTVTVSAKRASCQGCANERIEMLWTIKKGYSEVAEASTAEEALRIVDDIKVRKAADPLPLESVGDAKF